MTKQLILERALEFFTDRGYEGASMEDIARAVGIRKASLYAHFEGKERIFLSVFEDILEEYARTVEALTAPSEEDALLALERIFLAFVDYCHGSRKMYFWDRYFYYPPECVKGSIVPKTLETQEVFLQRIRWWMERGVERGRAPRAAGAKPCALLLLPDDGPLHVRQNVRQGGHVAGSAFGLGGPEIGIQYQS